DPGSPQLWSNLAASLSALGQNQAQMDAVERALALEPRHLAALLLKGAAIEARGDLRNAARAYRNALATIPSGAALPPSFSAEIERAREVVRKDDETLAAAIEERLAGIRDQHGGGHFRRVERCLELLTRKRSRYLPEPTFMYFPEIPALE